MGIAQSVERVTCWGPTLCGERRGFAFSGSFSFGVGKKERGVGEGGGEGQGVERRESDRREDEVEKIVW